MHIRDFVVLAYDAFGGSINGKTTLQKRVYFLGIMLRKDPVRDLGYKPHYYGPYSARVANANSELKALGYLSESVASWGSVSPQGFEIARYDYKLTDDGRELAERKKKELTPDWQRMKAAAEKIEEAGNIDYMGLSVAAKAYFILRKGRGKTTLGTIRNVAEKFDWSIGNEELQQAAEFLEKIDLVSRR